MPNKIGKTTEPEDITKNDINELRFGTKDPLVAI